MQLSDEERQAVRSAIEATRELNACLQRLRDLRIGCNIRETPDGKQWLLDAKAIITRKHYD